MNAPRQQQTERAGWTIADWCAATSVSRAKLYDMSPDIAPRSVSLGRRRIIIEAPAQWLRRIADSQSEEAT